MKFIVIENLNGKVPKELNISYNITKGVIGTTYGKITPITLEQKEYIYNELLKAISLASTITIDNMTKKGYSKK